MATATKPATDLVALAVEIRIEVQAAELSWRDTLAHAIRAGTLLIEAKAQVKHGEWIPWLGENFDGTVRCAQRYMRLAANANDVSHLPTVTEALGALEQNRDPGSDHTLQAVQGRSQPGRAFNLPNGHYHDPPNPHPSRACFRGSGRGSRLPGLRLRPVPEHADEGPGMTESFETALATVPTSRRIADRHGLSRPEARTRRRPRREESRAAGAHGRRRQDRRRAGSNVWHPVSVVRSWTRRASPPGCRTRHEVDAHRRVLGVNRVELVQGLQRCPAPDCDAVPTTSTGSWLVNVTRWHCPAHVHLAAPGDMDDLGCGVRLLGARRARPARSAPPRPASGPPPNPTVPSNRRARPTATLTPARTSSTSAASASSWSIARRLHRRRATGRVIQLRKGRLLHEVAVWAASAARSPRDAHTSRIGPTSAVNGGIGRREACG